MSAAVERKISLINIFGKASAVTGTAAGAYVYFELARVLIAATDTQNVFNPADHVAPGLIALGVSLAAGAGGIYMGHMKRRLVDEFNLQVKRELEKSGFELVEDINETGQKTTTYRRIDYPDYTPPRSNYNGSFWDGFLLSSMTRSGGSRSSSSGSIFGGSRSSRSSGNGNNKGAAILIAGIVLAVAAAAAAYVSYKSLTANFSKTPDLLTTPDPALLPPAPAAP